MPGSVTVSVCVVGLLIVIAGKLSLGRSFGLIPANRGIVSSGLYRVVRHPIYLGYLITHVAFLAANPTLWNVALLVVADIALLARAVCEEQTLAKDPRIARIRLACAGASCRGVLSGGRGRLASGACWHALRPCG